MPGDGGYGSRDFDEDDDKENEEPGDGDSSGDNRNNAKRNKIKKCRYGNVPEELDWRKYGMSKKKVFRDYYTFLENCPPIPPPPGPFSLILLSE